MTKCLVSAEVLLPSEYNPGAAHRNTSVVASATTGNGGYSFAHVPQGTCSIEAIDTVNGRRTLNTSVAVTGEEVRIPDDTSRLRKKAAIRRSASKWRQVLRGCLPIRLGEKPVVYIIRSH